MAKQESRNGYVKRYNVQKEHKEFGKTKNYDFEKQNEPSQRMGNDSFANLPSEPMMKNFSRSHNYRSGVVNDFSCGLEEESGIHENKSYKNDQEYPQIMAMLRPKGKPEKIAQSIMRGKGVKVGKGGERMDKVKVPAPYMQHQEDMDKLINKVKKDLKKGVKDVKVLKKADKKFDRKISKCDMMMKKKKKK